MPPDAHSISASRPAVLDTQWGHSLHLLHADPETRSHSPFLGEDARRDNALGIQSGLTQRFLAEQDKSQYRFFFDRSHKALRDRIQIGTPRR
jgi:hypothetical protein